MQLDLSRLRRQQEHFERTFQPLEISEEDLYRLVAPVHLDMQIHKDKDRFRLVGTVRTELELLCSRCLEPFRMPVVLDFDQRYVPQSDASAEMETEVAEEDLETSFYRNNQIDLDVLLREQFYLALPMKPLCHDDCRGLCAQCGTNLNSGSCHCGPGWEDPRLSALRGLVPSQSSKS
jgi:DUF177 domain-containing protein